MKKQEVTIKACECDFNGKNPKAACFLKEPCGKPILRKRRTAETAKQEGGKE